MFINLVGKFNYSFTFETHAGEVVVKYHPMDYDTINNDPQMSIELHAMMRCASILQSRCTITQTQGNA